MSNEGNYLYALALKRFNERGAIHEYYWADDGNLHVILPGGEHLKIKDETVVIDAFVTGMYVGEIAR